jgi:hypothetical protein
VKGNALGPRGLGLELGQHIGLHCSGALRQLARVELRDEATEDFEMETRMGAVIDQVVIWEIWLV